MLSVTLLTPADPCVAAYKTQRNNHTEETTDVNKPTTDVKNTTSENTTDLMKIWLMKTRLKSEITKLNIKIKSKLVNYKMSR